MGSEKVATASAICLTTIDYAVYGSPLVATTCPACGVKLLIKHDNFVNRITSITLVLGMSLIIGYNLGRSNNWLGRLKRRLFRILGLHSENGDHGGDTDDHQRRRRHQQQLYFSNGNDNLYQRPPEEMEKMSDHTCDSAIEMPILGDFEFDDQLYDLLNYNDYQTAYQDYFLPGEDNIFASSILLSPTSTEPQSSIPSSHLQTQTVDRIDQVLHQIDDIKKSIVEIDDELYHIAGATYANFNPNFFTLTNDYADLEELINEGAAGSSGHRSLDEMSTTSSDVDRRQHNPHFNKQPQPSHHQISAYSRKASGPRHLCPPRPIGTKKSNSADDLIEYHRRAVESKLRTPLDSQTSSDVDSVQLEWDFDDFEHFDKISSSFESQNIPKQKIETDAVIVAATLPPMTDEQKLHNMNELLDEAKRLGLLNNILDALQRRPSDASLRKNTKNRKSPFQAIQTTKTISFGSSFTDGEVIKTTDEFIDDFDYELNQTLHENDTS